MQAASYPKNISAHTTFAEGLRKFKIGSIPIALFPKSFLHLYEKTPMSCY